MHSCCDIPARSDKTWVLSVNACILFFFCSCRRTTRPPRACGVITVSFVPCIAAGASSGRERARRRCRRLGRAACCGAAAVNRGDGRAVRPPCCGAGVGLPGRQPPPSSTLCQRRRYRTGARTHRPMSVLPAWLCLQILNVGLFFDLISSRRDRHNSLSDSHVADKPYISYEDSSSH